MRLFHVCGRVFVTALAVAFAGALLTACVSGPVQVPEGTSAAKIIQLGQEAADQYRYDQALEYYNLVLERFPFNSDAICAAEYEIAHIHYKQEKYTAAEAELQALLERYNTADAELLPPQYKRLAEIALEKIAEKRP
jgi:outer membrane protein assembly factor BamD (BamD/ComL family)